MYRIDSYVEYSVILMLNQKVVDVIISIYFSFLSVIFIHHFPFLYLNIRQEIYIC